jgi:hypothetical protein
MVQRRRKGNLVSDIATIEVSASGHDKKCPTFTVSGGGNALLVHLGALHRLCEIGLLKGLRVIGGANSTFVVEELKILDDWRIRADAISDKENLLPSTFTLPLRNLRREKNWVSRWKSTPLERQLKYFGASLELPSGDRLSWSSDEGCHDARLMISKSRHIEMVNLALSPHCLPELGMDYLVDWGYALCDGALGQKETEGSPTDKALISPNRLFYRSFADAREAPLPSIGPIAPNASNDQADIKAA